MGVVLEIFFLNFSNIDLQFVEKKLVQRNYTVVEALSITRKVKIINKKDFAKVALNEDVETFVVHIIPLCLGLMIIHSARKAQMDSLFIKGVTVLIKYADFTVIFSKESVKILSESISINDYTIKLLDSKLLYGSIYNLSLVELKTLKIYIENNLANDFIQSSESHTGAPIFFIQKSHKSF